MNVRKQLLETNWHHKAPNVLAPTRKKQLVSWEVEICGVLIFQQRYSTVQSYHNMHTKLLMGN